MGNFQVAFSGLVQGRSLQHMGWKVWASDSPAAPSGQPRRSAGSTGSAGSRDPVSAPGLPKGLVETCFAPSKMPPKSGYCCSAVAQWQTPPPFFFPDGNKVCEKISMGVAIGTQVPHRPQAGRLGEPCSAVPTRKEGADGPVLERLRSGESACEYLSCTDVLACLGWDASVEAAATALEQGDAQPGRGEDLS